jgi:hypothetical protein
MALLPLVWPASTQLSLRSSWRTFFLGMQDFRRLNRFFFKLAPSRLARIVY